MAAGQSQLLAAHTTASSSSAVVFDGKIVYTGAFGERDIERDLPATPQTVYRIGSVTKLFTAVAVMQLVEQQRLSLDAKLIDFVPTISGAQNITVRELLMHRSGIRDYLDAAVSSGRVAAATTPQAIVADAAEGSTEAPPGTQYSYSNTNYVLLGLIIEKVTGEPLHDYYRRHIFTPAGMTSTYAGTAPSDAQLAVGYTLSQGRAPLSPGDASWYYACGDILSTAEDLARFDIALMTNKLVRKATLEEMLSSAQATGEPRVSYGLGIMEFPFGTQTIAGHHGGLPGFEADDEMILKDGFAVITLGNDFLYPTSVALNSAVQTYYANDFAQAVQDAHRARSADSEQPALTQRFTSFLNTMIHGQAPPANDLSPEMARALSQAAVSSIARQIASMGTFEKLEYVSADSNGPYRRYHYRAKFSSGVQPMVFVLDANQKLAGFFNE